MKLTKLSKKQFEEILDKYSIGKYKKFKHMKWALGNTVYILETTKGKFVLKILEMANLNYLKYQIKLINFLRERKIPVQKIIKTNNNNFFLKYNGKRILLLKFIEGKTPKALSDKLVKDIANKMGLMHKHFLKLKLHGEHIWKKDHAFKKLDKNLKKVNEFNFNEEENNLLKDMRKIDRKKLRKSVVHGDCHSVNLLIKDDKLKSIIDWDDAHEDYLIYDLSTFIMHSFVRKTKVNKKQIKIFLIEYQTKIKLNEEEKKALYFFIKQRFLAVIEWVSDQMENHKDLAKDLQKDRKDDIKQYKVFNKISLDEFLELLEE